MSQAQSPKNLTPKQRFKGTFGWLCRCYPHVRDGHVAWDAYWSVLQDLPIDALVDTMHDWARKSEQFPSAAKLRNEVIRRRGNRKPQAHRLFKPPDDICPEQIERNKQRVGKLLSELVGKMGVD